MKHLIKMGLVPLACLCLVFSCDVQSDALSEFTQMRQSVTSVAPDIANRVQLVNGLLRFEDGDAFDKVVDALDLRESKWAEELLFKVSGYWVDELDGMTPEELERIADRVEARELEMGINGDHTYESFEEQMHFKSLRGVLVGLENEFLNDPDPDWDNNPDDHFISGTAERTLFNSRGEIMVEEKLYKVFPNGLTYEVTDGNFETLGAITGRYEREVFEADNVEVYNTEVLEGRYDACKTYVRHNDQIQYNPGRARYNAQAGHRSLIFSNRAYSTVKHYRKIGRKWKRRRGHLKAKVWGQHGLADPGNLNAHCDRQAKFNGPAKEAFRRRLTSRYKTFGIGFGKIESGKVTVYYGVNGHITYATLYF